MKLSQDALEAIAKLQAERKAQQKPAKPSVAAIAADLADTFGAMIDKAPDGPPRDFLGESLKICPINVRDGWDERYQEEVELRGAEWISTFEDAKLTVAAGGIALFLGGRGTGKTRMAAEIARSGFFPTDRGQWNGNRMTVGKTALYRRSLDVFLKLRGADAAGQIETLSHSGLLVLDEFQERGETAFEDRMMTTIIDRRYAASKPTIIIANLSREEAKKQLSPSVIDRMRENGKGFNFDWNSYR